MRFAHPHFCCTSMAAKRNSRSGWTTGEKLKRALWFGELAMYTAYTLVANINMFYKSTWIYIKNICSFSRSLFLLNENLSLVILWASVCWRAKDGKKALEYVARIQFFRWISRCGIAKWESYFYTCETHRSTPRSPSPFCGISSFFFRLFL